MSNRATLMLIAILTASSLMMVDSVFAQSISKPAVPEFTVKLINHSVIEVTIKNQPFTSYYDDSLGQHVFLYYNIRLKDHFEGGWTELYRASDGYLHQWSDSDYTVRTLHTETGTGITIAIRDGFSLTFPAGDQVDFQVEAMIGYVHRDVSQASAPWVFTGEKSGWSSTQTITLPTPTPSPAPTPPPELVGTTLGVVVAVLVVSAVLLSIHKRNKPKQPQGVIAVAVIVAGLGLLIYFKKHKREVYNHE